MPDSISKTVESREQVSACLNWADAMICKALAAGPVAVTLGRPEERRSNEQNKKQWAMYNDLSKQLQWYGNKMEPEDWKDLLGHEWRGQRIVPGISGGFVALGNVRTSKMRKREMSELIEIVYAFGAEHGVRWSEPALAEFEKYREAQ